MLPVQIEVFQYIFFIYFFFFRKSLFKSSTTNNELIDKNSLFYQLITESGFNFTQGDESNELSKLYHIKLILQYIKIL